MIRFINPVQFTLVAVWTVVCAIVAAAFVTVTFRKDMTSFIARTLWSPVILLFCGVRLVITGKENIIKDKSFIYISNHESMLDIPAIFAAVPVNLFFIAKKELKKVPFMGWAMQLGGMIFIDRKNKEQAKKDMERAGVLIRKGKNIISYPEGTRTKTGELGLFRRGTFLLSINTEIEIVPITIKGARELLPSGSFYLKPGKIYIHLSPPLSPAGYSADKAEIFASDVRQRVLETKEKL